ncbi:hypothetical protein V8N76_004575 [Salmonella enterica]
MNATERKAAQALIDYLAEKFLTGSEQFRDFIKATGLATGAIIDMGEHFTRADRWALDIYHPATIDGMATRLFFATREAAMAALEAIKADTAAAPEPDTEPEPAALAEPEPAAPATTIYSWDRMPLDALIDSWNFAGFEYPCDGDRKTWNPDDITTEPARA